MEPVEQRAADENKGGEATEWRRPYLSPVLYTYGRIDDMTEYAGIINSDGPVGSSGAP